MIKEKRVKSLLFIFMICSIFLSAAHEDEYGWWIRARYVDGFGSNHGWHDVDNAEGDDPYPGDYAWKYINVDTYGRLLKAYDFEQWIPSRPIIGIVVFCKIKVVGATPQNSVNVQLRVYDGSKVIAEQTDLHQWEDEYERWIQIHPPTPPGGWTKEYIDSLQLWVGAKNRSDVYLYVYNFGIFVAHEWY
jgi:hypothetical protein